MDGLVAQSMHGYAACVSLLIGFIFLALFLTTSSNQDGIKLIAMQIMLAAVSSVGLGFGTIFAFLWGGVFV
jgi:hypothetical protein